MAVLACLRGSGRFLGTPFVNVHAYRARLPPSRALFLFGCGTPISARQGAGSAKSAR